MADYYSILKKTIDGLSKNTPELRNAVYQKARTAIGNQLRGMNPPPAEEAIASQLQLLEDAILVVDMEYSGGPTEEPPQPSPEPMEPAAVVEPTPAPPAPEPPAPPPPPAATSPLEPISPASSDPVAPPQPMEPQVAAASSVPAGMASEPPTVGMVPPPQPSVPGGDAGMAAPDMAAPSPAPAAAAPDAGVLPADDQMDPFTSRRKKGILGKLVAGLVVLAVLLGGGYALWLNRDSLQPVIASLFSSDDKQTVGTEGSDTGTVSDGEQAIDDDTAAQSEKESVKLGADGSDTEVSPAGTDEQPRVVGAEEEVVGEDPAAEGTNDGGVAEVEQPLPIGEVAYLYEEGSAGSGATRTNAAIAWESSQEVLADGLPPEPVILGNMQVPEKDLSIDIEIKRNVDEALSASHIIEVRFNVPEGFSGSNIDNIARFVMKSSEEARGEPLVAVPVKVSDGFFLIALDNLKQAVDVNTRLMLDSSWIDIPISYATGKRALITLEKGGTGTRIFQEAFGDWQNR